MLFRSDTLALLVVLAAAPVFLVVAVTEQAVLRVLQEHIQQAAPLVMEAPVAVVPVMAAAHPVAAVPDNMVEVLKAAVQRQALFVSFGVMAEHSHPHSQQISNI